MTHSLKLLYKLLLDGGKVIDYKREVDTYTIQILPNSNLTAEECLVRYGIWGLGPLTVMLPNPKDFYAEIYEGL